MYSFVFCRVFIVLVDFRLHCVTTVTPFIRRSFEGYIERKAVELKLTGIALNRSKNHIGERTTDKGLQVGFF